jgi:hypothetical protein
LPNENPGSPPLSEAESEWKTWLTHPCTKKLREWAREQREAHRYAWENSEYVAENFQATVIANASAIGACNILRYMEQLDYNDFKENDNDLSDAAEAKPGG